MRVGMPCLSMKDLGDISAKFNKSHNGLAQRAAYSPHITTSFRQATQASTIDGLL
jgi:hypothetical protein